MVLENQCIKINWRCIKFVTCAVNTMYGYSINSVFVDTSVVFADT